MDLTLARKNSGAVYNVRVLRQLPRPPQSVRNVRLVATDNPTAQSPPTTGPSRRDSGDPHNERSNGTDGGHGPNSARTSNHLINQTDFKFIEVATTASAEAAAFTKTQGFMGLVVSNGQPHAIREV